MANNFDALMQGFGVVTVMNATIYKLRDGKRYVGKGACKHTPGTSDGALTPQDFYCTGLYLDTLKIANFTQEGPTKTVTGGQYANPLIKYGKTMTCEMQDALGRAATMVEFFGCKYDGVGRLSVTDKFPGAFAIEGKTFFINQKTGEKEYVYIFIPQFTPDAILTLTQDAEGDATVFDLNGTVSVTKIADDAEDEARDIFYEIRSESFFQNADSTNPTNQTVETQTPNYDTWHAKDGVKYYTVTLVTDAGVMKTLHVEQTKSVDLPNSYTWKTAAGVVANDEYVPTADVVLIGTKIA